MEMWHIRGGNRLSGVCEVQGSKNAALPIIAASILAPRLSFLQNVPMLSDVNAALQILRHLGCSAEQQGNELRIDSTGLSRFRIPRELMEQMRSSVIFMGALIARCGEAKLSLPGGCPLGERPIDLHLMALRKLGARIVEEDGEIHCIGKDLKGTRIRLPFPSVGATENTMLAACRAKGETVLYGAAREPEIVALQEYLRSMGAQIVGAGSDVIRIDGMRRCEAVRHRILPDRIVGATLACAAAATGGELELRNVEPSHFSTVLYFLNRAGCDIIKKEKSLRLTSPLRLRAVERVVTAPYPGFPTDAQPLLMAALLRSDGTTEIRETIFEKRFRQVPELCRLGADIRVDGGLALVRGVERLKGAALRATDLRGAAAMLLAGLTAEGETLVCDEGHISRGYERFDERLRSLGAEIRLES